jgi:hypothetical protein
MDTMRLSLWCICAVILLALAGCDDYSNSGNVLEIKCVENTGFDDDKLCLKPNRPGAELAFRVNERTGTALITIIQNDGNWGVKDLFLEHCSVVDTTNWKCTETVGKPEGPLYAVTEYGMVHGRYYRSLTGSPIGTSSPDFYTSSISGRTFLALHNNRMDMRSALTVTGYSAETFPCSLVGGPDCLKELYRRLSKP